MNIKKISLVLSVFMLLCCICSAEAVGTADDSKLIYRHIEPKTKQELFFITTLEPKFSYVDIDGDGDEDLEILTCEGMHDLQYEIFIYDKGKFSRLECEFGMLPIVSYTLPKKGYITSEINNGLAGALFEKCLYKIDGARLIPVRSASGRVNQSFNNGVTTSDDSILKYTVKSHSGKEKILFEQVVSTNDDNFSDIFEKIDKILLKGKP